MKIYEYIVRIKDQATNKLRGLLGSTNQSAAALRGLSSYANTASSNLFSLAGAAGFLTRGLGVAALAGALTFVGGRAVSLAADLEQTQVGFEVMLGSAEKATKMISDIRQFAKVTPFETTDLVKASETMLGFGVAGDQIMPTLRMLGDVSRGSAEKLRLISLAYSQIQSAGRLMGQDLLQLVNAGFNPLQEISARTGKSMAQLKKEMEAGSISAEMVTDAFRSATSEGGRFFGMMERQSQTFHGMVSTLRDEWNESLIDLGQRILPYAINSVKSLRSVLSDLVNRVDFSPLVMAFNDMYSITRELWGVVGDLWSIMGLASDQASVLQYTMNGLAFIFRLATTPARAFYTWIMFIVDAAKAAAQTFMSFGEIIDGVFEFDKEKIAAGFDSMVNTAGAGFDQLKKRVQDFVNSEKEGYAAIFNTGPKSPIENPQAFAGAAGAPGGSAAGSKPDKKTQQGIDKIAGGGRQSVNVTINLNNLIGQQNFDVKNVKESVRDMEQQTIEALLRVLNSANYATAQ